MKILIFITLFISHIIAYGNSINVGVLKFAPPFSAMTGNGNQYFGFVIDVMNEICHRMNQKCSYTGAEASEQYAMLNQGLIDISFIPTPIISESEGNYIFSLPYLASNGQFITLKENNINSLADIKNRKVGVVEDTLYKVLVQSNYATFSDIKKFTVITDLVSALTSHKIDVALINDQVAKYLANNAIHPFIMVGDQISLGKGYGVIALKKNAELIKRFNEILLAMEADGSYLTIYNKYFSN